MEHLSIGETAKLLGVSVSTLRRWECEGKSVTVGLRIAPLAVIGVIYGKIYSIFVDNLRQNCVKQSLMHEYPRMTKKTI
jgi:transcriptional regulator with XRE-family HTH domain